MTKPQNAGDREGARVDRIEKDRDPLEIGQVERSLKLVRQIEVTAREIMDGGSPRSPSGAAYDIYRAARSVCWTLKIIHDEHWHKANIEALEDAERLDRYIEVNTSRRPDDLRRASAEIAARFGLQLPSQLRSG